MNTTKTNPSNFFMGNSLLRSMAIKYFSEGSGISTDSTHSRLRAGTTLIQDPSPLQEADHHDDQEDHQDQVDQAPTERCNKRPQQPQNEEDHDDCFECI